MSDLLQAVFATPLVQSAATLSGELLLPRHSPEAFKNFITYREKTGTSEAEIDIYFGWHEKILLKEMQNHYSAFDIRERMQKAKITKMI